MENAAGETDLGQKWSQDQKSNCAHNNIENWQDHVGGGIHMSGV